MAFFGLTSLGPQNCFSQADRQTRNLHIFDAEDFQNAWVKVVGPAARFAEVNQLGKIMRVLFRGPIPPSDQYQIELALDDNMDSFETPTAISFVMYMDIMMKLRYEAAQQEKIAESRPGASESCEFSSSIQFKDSFIRHRRLKEDMNAKQLTPLTSSQEVGWEKQELKRPIAGREGSEITKFAAELVKNGVYY